MQGHPWDRLATQLATWLENLSQQATKCLRGNNFEQKSPSCTPTVFYVMGIATIVECYHYKDHKHVHAKVSGFCFNFIVHHLFPAPWQDDLLTSFGDSPPRSLGPGTTRIQRPWVLPNMVALPKCSLSALWKQCCHMFAIESLTRGCLENGGPTCRDIAMNLVEPPAIDAPSYETCWGIFKCVATWIVTCQFSNYGYKLFRDILRKPFDSLTLMGWWFNRFTVD